jgi:chromosomal replication initiation ATPase DnaA
MSKKSTGKQNNDVVQEMTQRQRILLRIACRELKVRVDDVIRGKNRKKDVLLAKHIVMYILRERWGLSYGKIGSFFMPNGNGKNKTMNHTSVMYAVERIKNDMELGYDDTTSVYQNTCKYLDKTIAEEVPPTKIIITVNDDFNHERLAEIFKTHYGNLKYEIG